MAWLEKRGQLFRIVFRFGDRKHQIALKTDDEDEANISLARFEDNLRLVTRGRLVIPTGLHILHALVQPGRHVTANFPVAQARVDGFALVSQLDQATTYRLYTVPIEARGQIIAQQELRPGSQPGQVDPPHCRRAVQGNVQAAAVI